MSRRSKNIIELALAKSKIIQSTDTNEDVSGDHSTNCDDDEKDNSPPVFIQTGDDLVTFKYGLRERSSVLTQNLQDSDYIEEPEEPYSPNVSEYFPPDNYQASNLTHTASTESFNEQQFVEECTNENIIESILDDIRNEGNVEVTETTEQTIASYEEQPSSSIVVSSAVGNAPPKKMYPKKSNPGRKRTVNKENWKAKIAKKKKNLGEEFVNSKGQLICKKEIKPSCGANCSRKCIEKISEIQRKSIFTEFWSLGDHNKQMDYIGRLIKRVQKKQILFKEGGSSRRKWSLEYYLLFTGEEIRVCKKMFLNTFSISDMWVQTFFKKLDRSQTGCVTNDIRGIHQTRHNAISDQVKQSVREHISNIPLVESHYVRKRSSKLYIDDQLSLPKLYELYQEWMKENHSDQTVASLRQYRNIFVTEFNIDFNKPKKDQCPRCDLFNNSSASDKIKLEYEQALHIANKHVVRALKDSDKQRAKNSNRVIAACYDLQKILTTPQSEVSVFYYKRKLAAYNFTIFDLGQSKGYCYLWDETIGRKGSNEISSFVFDFIKNKVHEGYTEFNFYSDSCSGQNRNRIVFAMYAYATKIFNIDINHHFFEVGHSQSEGDAMHALIERRKKNKVIYVSHQWATLIRCAKSTGEPYVVYEVNQDLILDYKQLLPYYRNWDYDINHKKVSWNKIMHIRSDKCLLNMLMFQYDSLSDNEITIDLAYQTGMRTATRRSNRGTQTTNQELPVTIAKAYRAPLPITSAKYKDLANLCKCKAIPEIYRDYYLNLPHGSQTNDSDSD